tara:strand:- start:282 stop:857 length:576 start_codon:yes stop_codon:yes gene_type:complete
MDRSSSKGDEKQKITVVKTFPVPFPLIENQGNLIIHTNILSNPFREKIINKARKLHKQGNFTEATKYYQQLINEGCNDHRVLSNYGAILMGLGKLKEAELYIRKAIKVKPDYAEAYSNLAIILGDLGKLKEAEMSYRKAIEIQPDYAEAYSNLGNIFKDLGKLKEAEISTTAKQLKLNLISQMHITIWELY